MCESHIYSKIQINSTFYISFISYTLRIRQKVHLSIISETLWDQILKDTLFIKGKKKPPIFFYYFLCVVCFVVPFVLVYTALSILWNIQVIRNETPMLLSIMKDNEICFRHSEWLWLTLDAFVPTEGQGRCRVIGGELWGEDLCLKCFIRWISECWNQSQEQIFSFLSSTAIKNSCFFVLF